MNILLLQDEYDIWLQKAKDLKQEYTEAWKAIGEAAGPSCDWHDNFAFDDAQRVFGVIWEKIQEVNKILSSGKIISTSEKQIVAIGKRISILIDDTEQKDLFIGGYQTPIQGRVSYNAPIVAPLMGKEIGDFVEIELHGKKKEIEILNIR